jgi:integrase
MFTYKAVFNRRNTLDKHGKAPIEMRITLNRIPHFLKIGYSIFPQHWDVKKCKANTKCPTWHDINTAIAEMENRLYRYQADRQRANQKAEIDEIKFLFRKKKIDEDSFLDFAQEKLEMRADLKEDTRSDQLNQVGKLREWYPNGISFSQIDYLWLEAFEAKMIKKKLKPGTRWKYHKVVKTYLSFARKQHLVTVDPYQDFKVYKPKESREALTLDELKKLEDLDRSELVPLECVTLDMFLFSCYTGLRISDYGNLSTDNIIRERKGYYLVYNPKKGKLIAGVKKSKPIPLHELFNGKPVEIYKKYAAQSEMQTRRLFPAVAEHIIARHLKKIGKLAKINTHISFHIARHTCGSALAELTNDVLLIGWILGHSKMETSMVYIHMSKRRIESKLAKVNFDH